ncbi:MAG: 16S rRNA (adenine(1518)-N(6)/adenine(1519)-N(6))-dimethyltransferase RsmA [Chthoniobacteraceae bacterium]
MTRTEINEALEQLGTRPTKSLGQNFLHDQNLSAWLVDQLEITPGDHVVEIGPGLGALSEHVIPKAGFSTLIEKDGRLAGYLGERFAGNPAVEIHHLDALDYDPRHLFLKGPAKLLGNLPYYVTSPIMFHFAAEPSPVSRMVLTMQKEVAERLSAAPRTKEYGALTLVIGRRWRVKYLRTLPPEVFMPAPKVDSAAILLLPRAADEFPACDGATFERLVKQGFSQRRKRAQKMLRALEVDFLSLADQIGASPQARAEELSLGQWIDLTNLVAPLSKAEAQDVHGEIFDIVNEHNEVVSQATRHEAHEQKLRHRAVHIFVFNKKGELFLQKRFRWKDKNPGAWDSSAAGHVNAGDDYAATATRELMEELGVNAPVKPIAELAASENTGYEFVKLYAGRHEGPFILPPAEIESGGFFPVPLLRQWTAERPRDFARSFIECLRLLPEDFRLD